jgi:hypothetical protein
MKGISSYVGHKAERQWLKLIVPSHKALSSEVRLASRILELLPDPEPSCSNMRTLK